MSVIDEAQALDAVQEALRAAIAAAPWPPTLSDVVADILAEPLRVLGGRLTPWALLPLCCCVAAGGDWRPAIRAAAAAEVCAAACEILDDVEDGDTSAVLERYGAPVALNAATALLALMHLVLCTPGRGDDAAGAEARRYAHDTLWLGFATATGGQHIDLSTTGAAPLSVEGCLDIARRKSGALTAACCRAGARFGTADAALIAHFDRLGTAIGVFAQLDNDMRGAGDAAAKSDLALRKQTVPISFARAGDDGAALGDAVRNGGIQLAYALVYAELARAQEALEDAAGTCPDPAVARAVLHMLLPRDAVSAAGAV